MSYPCLVLTKHNGREMLRKQQKEDTLEDSTGAGGTTNCVNYEQKSKVEGPPLPYRISVIMKTEQVSVL
jgi:hypothetical protein